MKINSDEVLWKVQKIEVANRSQEEIQREDKDIKLSQLLSDFLKFYFTKEKDVEEEKLSSAASKIFTGYDIKTKEFLDLLYLKIDFSNEKSKDSKKALDSNF